MTEGMEAIDDRIFSTFYPLRHGIRPDTSPRQGEALRADCPAWIVSHYDWERIIMTWKMVPFLQGTISGDFRLLLEQQKTKVPFWYLPLKRKRGNSFRNSLLKVRFLPCFLT